MATIESTVLLNDAMSPALNHVCGALNLVIRGFDQMQNASSQAIDTANLEAAQREMAETGAALTRLKEMMEAVARPAPPPAWQSGSQMPIFQTQGLVRYRQETEAARLAMANLAAMQSQITLRAQNTQLFSGHAAADLTNLQNRMGALQGRIDQLSRRRIGTMGAAAASAQMESLRARMQQALNIQSELNRAVRGMDVSAANAAYQRLLGTIGGMEQEIRDNTAQQQRFNSSVNSGVTGASRLLGLIRSVAGAYMGINAAKGIVGLSDQMASANARLNLMNDGMRTNEQLQQMIYQSAQRSRSAYLDTVQTVSKLGILARDAFSSNEEMVAFVELMNKQFVIGGASVQEQTAAMYQLTQAMAAGRLQGDEFRSIMENAPLLAQAIAEKMGKTTGELREASSQGAITADVIKAALFGTADEINERFENMPMTWGQVWITVSNRLIMAMQPLLTFINLLAQNWGTLEPIVIGVVAAIGVYVLAMGAASLATSGFFAVLMSNPLFWIAAVIGIIIGYFYKWVQAVGGVRVAWLIVKSVFLSTLDAIKIRFFTVVYGVLDHLNQLQIGWLTVVTNVKNWAGDLKVGVLLKIQEMANGAIDIINWFIEKLNMIPGVAIDTIQRLTFATNAQLENEAAKQARNEELDDYRTEFENAMLERDEKLAGMQRQAQENYRWRQVDIEMARRQAAAAADEAATTPDYSGFLSDIAANTAASADALDLNNEELEWMRDLAEQEAISRFTTTEIRVDMGGVTQNVASYLDTETLTHRMVAAINSGAEMAAEGVYA